MGCLPASIPPMLAVAGELPATDAGWSYEIKWDGVRAIVLLEEGTARVLSRSGRDVSVAYPELQPLAAAAGARALALDGEIVALDEQGRPSFGRLQPRMHVLDPHRAALLAERTPATLMVFDVLQVDERATLPLPYEERRRLLESLDLHGESWRTPPRFTGDGHAVAEGAAEQGLEGVVAKLSASPYRPGRRSSAWRKVKSTATQDVVVAGYTLGEGSRGSSFGALVLGVPGPDGRLVYIGRVGSGFAEGDLADLLARLEPLRTEVNPFGGALEQRVPGRVVWVEPRLVGEVRYQEWSRDRRLRAPIWRGLREDLEPADVVAGW